MQNSKKQARQGGFAMIMVLCVGALFVALATALLFAASLLTANANRQLTEQEVYGMASTFSACLDADLTGYDSLNTAVDNSFGEQVLDYLYSGNDTVVFRSNPSDLSNLGGAETLEITLSNKRPGDATSDSPTVLTSSDLTSDVLKEANMADTVYTFDVSVKAELKGQTFFYTQTYRCKALPYYTFGDNTDRYFFDDKKTEALNHGSDRITPAQAKEKAEAGTAVTRYSGVVDGAPPIAARFVNRAEEAEP